MRPIPPTAPLAPRPARAGFEERFEGQVDPDRTMTPEALANAVKSARKAYFVAVAF